MISKILFLFLALFSLQPSLLRGELFVTQKNEKGISLKYLAWNTKHFWDKKGNRENTWNKYEGKESSFHIEYGLTRCDILGLKAAYARADEELDGKQMGVTEFEFSWRRPFYSKKAQAIYLQVIGIIPPRSGYKPAVRYGQYGIEGAFAYTQNLSLFGISSFFYGDLGYRWYEGFPSDQIRSKLILYLCINRLFQFVARSELYYGVFNGKRRLDQSLVWMNPNFRLWRGEIEAVFHLYSCADLSIGCFRHFWGQNVGTGGGYFARATLIF